SCRVSACPRNHRELSYFGEVLLHARGNEGSRSLPAHQQAFTDEAIDRLAYGDARDLELGGKVALGRQCIIGPEHPGLDRLTQRPLQLLIQRQRVGLVQLAYGLRQCQSPSPACGLAASDTTNTGPVCAISLVASSVTTCSGRKN